MNNEDFLNLIGFKHIKQPHLLQLEIHLADHCNLNCRSCDHYSPLASESFPNFSSVHKDLAHLSEVLNGKIDNILLLGGEPLLNKDISKYIIMIRQLFKNSNITIVTNGTLLLNQSYDFYNTCKDNNILIEITKYPINFDYEQVVAFLNSMGVRFSFVGSTEIKEKTTHRLCLDENGTQDPVYSFNHCFHSTKCYQYYKGRIYICPCCAYIHNINHYFNKNFIVTKFDYLEVQDIRDEKQILDFLSKPIPFCKYCNVDKRTFKSKWSTSQRNQSEWL